MKIGAPRTRRDNVVIAGRRTFYRRDGNTQTGKDW